MPVFHRHNTSRHQALGILIALTAHLAVIPFQEVLVVVSGGRKGRSCGSKASTDRSELLMLATHALYSDLGLSQEQLRDNTEHRRRA
jgi:hypothetical protein